MTAPVYLTVVDLYPSSDFIIAGSPVIYYFRPSLSENLLIAI